MGDKDIQRLIDLFEDAAKHPSTKEEALALFVRAGIMDESGELTPPYKELLERDKE